MKSCIHKYTLKCQTNPQPPGFADFLRGTIALFYFSQKYGYSLLIDSEHPLFKFLKNNSKFTLCNASEQILEFLPPSSYDEIYVKLENTFNKGDSFSLITNSFYDYQYGRLSNFGNISHSCRQYMQDILQPSIEIENRLQYLSNYVYKINFSDPFKVIHLRCGDICIHSDVYDDNLYNRCYNKICEIMNQDVNIPYILLSDSSSIANKLKENITNLHYFANKKIHMGDLKFHEKDDSCYNNMSYSDSAIFDTLVDFFIMSKAITIIVPLVDSGFSKVASVIYNIPYIIS